MINISVIIPTCNRNDLLSECLDRVNPQSQLAGNFTYEVIVTDDGKEGSNAEELIKTKYNWARWTKGPAKGPASNRNNGASLATGNWLVFLDDDCLPDLDLLAGYCKLIADDNSIDVMEGVIYSDEQMKPFYIAPVNLTGGYLWSCNFAVKKAVYDAVGGFDKNFRYPHMEDGDLNDRLKTAGYTIAFNKDAKVYHAPRHVSSPKKLALYHESWIYYNAKRGIRVPLTKLLVDICNVRLRYMVKSTKWLSSIKALFLLVKELYYTILYSRNWDAHIKQLQEV